MRRLVPLLLCAVVASACFDARLDIDVGDDGSTHVIVAVDTADVLSGFVDQAFVDLPDDVVAEDYVDGGFRGVQFDAPADDLPLLEDGFVREEADGGWTFQLDIPPAPAVVGDASLEVSVRLPGRQVEQNADEIGPDGEMIWDVALDEGAFLEARTLPGDPILGDDGTGSVSWVLVGIVIVAILALTGIGVAVVRRSGPDRSVTG